MRPSAISFAVFVTLFGAAALSAQTPALTTDLVHDITEAEQKFVALANALSAEQYQWRPAPGVRSAQEVLLHVAADNYFLPAALGVPAPAETRITATDFQPVMAFEKQQLDKAATIAAVQTSFNHLRKALSGLPEERFKETVSVFGQDFTVQRFMILTATHMHEHLGQLIAYARSNGVKPPWSR
jgi:uncharacterized damage-inducible protein DinB